MENWRGSTSNSENGAEGAEQKVKILTFAEV
jgi:hypothetical protein